MKNELSKFLQRRYRKREILNGREEPWKMGDDEKYYSDIDYEHWRPYNLKEPHERYLDQLANRDAPKGDVNAPSIEYSDWNRIWFRSWGGERRKPKTAWWSGQIRDGHVELQLKCPFKDCGHILEVNVLLEGYISPEGYHNGSCIECVICDEHYWVVLDGWDDFRKKVKAEARHLLKERR